MKRISSSACILISTLMVLLCAGSAMAQSGGTPVSDDGLEVVISPGAKALTPMAITEATCVNAPRALCRSITAVMRRDMLLSFYVRVLPPRSYLADKDSETLTKTNWLAWGNVGARYLIKAEVTGPAPFKVEARLYNVAKKQAMKVTPQSFQGVSSKGMRKVAHRFCNGVMAALTGKAGVFGTRIAYAVRVRPGVKSIGIMDMDGAGRGGLVSNGSINLLPSWGLGGIFYTSFKRGKPDIYFGKRRISRDGGHYRKVAISKGGGKMIASISYGGQSDLYLISKAGKVLKNLTRSGADEVSPTFSPDGSKVAFVSSASGGPQIYMMSSSGGAKKRLTHAGSYNYAPDWGPNGLIAFAGMDSGSSDVFTVTEGGVVARLTQNQGSSRYPSWSPDGRYLAFVSRRKGRTRVWLMSADGRYQYPVARGGGVSNVAWQR